MREKSSNCPGERYLSAYVGRELDSKYAQKVGSHVGACVFCMQAVATLSMRSAPPTEDELRAATLGLTRVDMELRRRRREHASRRSEAPPPQSPRAVAAALRAEGLSCMGWLAAEGATARHPSHLGAAVALEPLSQTDLLLSHLVMATQPPPRVPEPFHALSIYYLFSACRGPEPDRGEMARARGALERAASLGLDAAVVANERGVMDLNEGLTVDAAEHFYEARRIAPGLLVASLNLALALTRLDLVVSASRLWTEVLSRVTEPAVRAEATGLFRRVEAEVQQLDQEIPKLEAALAAADPMSRATRALRHPILAHYWLRREAVKAETEQQASALLPAAAVLEPKVTGRYFPATVLRFILSPGRSIDAEAFARVGRLMGAYADEVPRFLTPKVKSDLDELLELTLALDDPRQLDALRILAGVHVYHGDLRAAQPLYEELCEASARWEMPELEGGGLAMLHWVRREGGDLSAESFALITRAIELQGSVLYAGGRAHALRVQGQSYEQTHDDARALASHAESLELQRRLDARRLSAIYNNLGVLYRRRERQVAALYFQEAFETSQLVEDDPAKQFIHLENLIKLEESREWPDLDRLAELSSRAEAASARQPIGFNALRADLQRLRKQLGELDAMTADERRQAVHALAKSLEQVERLKITDVATQLLDIESRYLERIEPELAAHLPHQTGEDAVEAALRLTEDVEATLADAIAALRFIAEPDRRALFSRRMDFVLQKLDDPGQRERLLVLTERARARLCLRGDSQFRPTPDTDPVAFVDELASGLDESTQLVSFYFHEGRLLAWVVGRGGLETLVTGIAQNTLETLAQRIHGAMHRQSQLELEAMAELADLLLPVLRDGGVAMAVGEGRGTLVIVPDGCLHDVPLELLPIDASGRTLLDAADIAYAPSLSAWETGRRAGAHHAVTEFEHPLHVSTPRLTAAQDNNLHLIGCARRVTALIGRVTEGELRVLDREEATPTNVLNEAESADLVHFTAHARNLGPQGAGAGIILAPGGPEGMLKADAIIRRTLRAQPLVVAPVCEGARSAWQPGEGGMGLPWAWLAAGARGAISPVARVDEQETLELLEELYARLAELGPRGALNEARRVCRARSPRRGAWVAFRIYE